MKESREPKNYMFVNVRFYKPDDYHSFKKLCDEMDLSITRAINGLVRQAIKENKLPYSEV